MALTEATGPNRLPTPLPQPCTPGPWKWQCHRCRIWYRLSCTRRCLSCSHIFCQRSNQLLGASAADFNTRKKRRRTRRGPCPSEFDFNTWAAQGSWKRTVRDQDQACTQRGNQPNPTSPISPISLNRDRRQPDDTFATFAPKTVRYRPNGKRKGWASAVVWDPLPVQDLEQVALRKSDMYVEGKHNCWFHCDYPSECRYSRAEGWKRKRSEEEGEDCASAFSPVEGTCWDLRVPDPDTSSTMSEEDEEEEKSYDYESVYRQDDQETRLTDSGSFSIYQDETGDLETGSRDDASPLPDREKEVDGGVGRLV